MESKPHLTFKQLEAHWGQYSRSTLRRWAKSGKLVTQAVDGETVIPLQENRELLQAMSFRTPRRRTYEVWAPEDLPDYGTWHDALDCNVWLLCVHYGSKAWLRRKGGRLDSMLARYLRDGKVSIQRIRRAFASTRNPSRAKAGQDLQRGWYHELAFATPLRAETLDLSARAVTLSMASSAERFAFPTWRIVAAYYSLYFFIRSASLLKTGSFRLKEHQAAINTFKNNLAGPLGSTLWRYPLSLTAKQTPTGVEFASKPPVTQHARYSYALHPRYPHRKPEELEGLLRRLYRRRLGRGVGDTYGMVDFLRDFRVWANYQDVDNLLKLQSGGFKAYLDRNLSVLLFFMAMVGELSYLAVNGQRAYVGRLQAFYEKVTADGGSILGNFHFSPPMQRLAVYCQLGLLDDGIELKQIVSPHAVLSDAQH